MSSIDLIQNKLNLSSANLSLISNNIANINTPNYKRKYIDVQGEDFSNILNNKLKQTHNKHISTNSLENGLIKEVDAYMRTDKNGVDADAEIVELNKNKLFYNSLVTLLNNNLNKMKTIITSK